MNKDGLPFISLPSVVDNPVNGKPYGTIETTSSMKYIKRILAPISSETVYLKNSFPRPWQWSKKHRYMLMHPNVMNTKKDSFEIFELKDLKIKKFPYVYYPIPGRKL